MDYTTERLSDAYHVIFSGPFTFGDNAAFGAILEQLQQQKIACVVMDFSGVSFIDSAALGMLLLLREEEKRPERIVLRGAVGQVKKMFDISKFSDLFVMEG